ncbi:ABC transporter ATP-binding protein [candidate division WWE3 bacterium]|nr:ABC transporter ATP-binding protein [candidate division WWE3 bacterium]
MQLLRNIIRTLGIQWQISKLKTLFIFMVAIGAPATSIASVYILGRFIDTITMISDNPSVTSRATILFIFLLVGGFLTELFKKLRLYVERIIFYDWHHEMIMRVNEKVSMLDFPTLENGTFNTLLNKIKIGYEHIPGNYMNPLFSMTSEGIRLISAVILISVVLPITAPIIVVSLIPQFFVSKEGSKLYWGIWDSRGEDAKRYFSTRDNLTSIGSIKEVKLFGLKDYLLNRIDIIITSFLAEQKRILSREMRLGIGAQIVEFVAIAGIQTWLLFNVLASKIAVGSFIFYLQTTNECISAGREFFRNLLKLHEFNLFMTDLFAFLDLQPTIISKTKAPKVSTKHVPLIEFRNVSFAYPNSGTNVFKDFSLTISPGEDIAIVGENGAGKTTFVKLLARLYDVTEGEILINGMNIKDIDLPSWHKNLGILFQDFNRYADSVKENIKLGNINQKVIMKEIQHAAKSAGADSFIQKFPHTYNQMLGSHFIHGIDVSGGQWQRIALARAYYRKANILILDEPTSAIDAKGEYEIFEKISKMQKDKTTIIISHRFSTVRMADKIYVVDKGKIIEQGDHRQLMAIKNGTYHSLFTTQAKGYT